MNFTDDFFTPCITSLEKILDKNKKIKILEIGSFEGRSTCWFLENYDCEITCVDLWNDIPNSESPSLVIPNSFYRFLENIQNYRDRVNIIHCNSKKILRMFPDNSFDFIFVDGSHEYYDVLKDAEQSLRLIKQDEIIFFDDFSMLSVKQALEEFLNRYKQNIKIIKNEDFLVIQKR